MEPIRDILIYSELLKGGPVKQNRRNNHNAEYVLTADRNQRYEEISIKDALAIQNAAFMIPRAMTTIVQEGIEPMLIASSLLQKVAYKPGMTTVFPAIEPLRADEAGDGMDLPIYNINIAGAQSFGVTAKRHGLRLKIAKSRSLCPVPEQQTRVRASKRRRDGPRHTLSCPGSHRGRTKPAGPQGNIWFPCRALGLFATNVMQITRKLPT